MSAPGDKCARKDCRSHPRRDHSDGPCSRCRCEAFVEKSASTAAAAWGYYAVIVLPEPTIGGTEPGMVPRTGPPRAFWAAWWRDGDPRRAVDPADPDDYGFVTGAKPIDEAVGAAYDALRKGRGAHIFDLCIGEAWAIRAYREGAPQRRSTHKDFVEIGRAGLRMLGCSTGEGDTECAAPADVKKAWRAYLQRAHPDKGGDGGVDMNEKRALYDAALVLAQLRADERSREEQAANPGGVILPEDKWHHLVRETARRVRSLCELLFRPMNLEGYDADSLAGYCVIASIGLVLALREAGIEATLGAGAVTSPHWWAEARRSRTSKPIIVDITATQFWRRARVLLLPPEHSKFASYRASSAGHTQAEIEAVPVRRHDALLWQGLPVDWWRGGDSVSQMTGAKRRALEHAMRGARRTHEYQGTIGDMLRRHPQKGPAR